MDLTSPLDDIKHAEMCQKPLVSPCFSDTICQYINIIPNRIYIDMSQINFITIVFSNIQ